MKPLSTLLPVLLLLPWLVACGENTGERLEVPTSQEQPATQEATLVRGEQVIRITIGPTGYDPSSIALKQGIPARLIFTRTTDNTCATEIHSPDLGIEKTALPLDEAVEVILMPENEGAFTFACGMDDMLKGTILVKS